VEAEENRYSGLPPGTRVSGWSGPCCGIQASNTTMSPTPSNQLRLINSPKVLPVSPSRLHPRIALTRPGDARVKAGGAVPLVEPELSLLCLEAMGKKSLYQINISMCECADLLGGPLPPFSMCGCRPATRINLIPTAWTQAASFLESGTPSSSRLFKKTEKTKGESHSLRSTSRGMAQVALR
jgi:hypothetical protein